MNRTPASRTDRKRIVALVILVLVVIWFVAFILSNSNDVRVSFVFFHVTLSLIWVLLICAALGAILASALPRLSRRRR